MDASGTPSIVLETFFQCLESYSLYFRKAIPLSSTLPPPSSSSLSPLNQQLDNQIPLYSFPEYEYDDNRNRSSKRYSMNKIDPFKLRDSHFTTSQVDDDRISLEYNNLNNQRIEDNITSEHQHDYQENISHNDDDEEGKKRYSLGVYGAIMKVYTN